MLIEPAALANCTDLVDESLIGKRISRVEDDRFLTGQAQYLADIQLPGTQEVAFIRSSVPHGQIRRISLPDDRLEETVWRGQDLQRLARPMVATVTRPEFRSAPYHALALDRVRFVGEAICAVVGRSRAAALDAADSIGVDVDALDPVIDAEAALEANAPRIHENWADNCYLATQRETQGFEAAVEGADVRLTRHYRMARAGAMPIETRGCIAWFDRRNNQLVLWTSTQRPHVIRSILATHLVGMDESRIRVITPDVGGAFGSKNNFYPEELILSAIALAVDHPVRWIETRSEHMLSTNQAREQTHRITVYAMRDGQLIGVDADILADGGAYSMLTSTGIIEANMAASVLPGPYRLPNYRFRARTACTNKTPVGPYRGVGRPGAVLAMECALEELARELKMDPNQLRLKNVVPADDFPWRTSTGLIYDSGNFPGLIRAAAHSLHSTASNDSVGPSEKVGSGYAMYVEQTAHGVTEWVARSAAFLSGFESARVTLDLSGTLTINVGVLSQGQGHETTLAQIAGSVTGIPLERIRVRQGDTNVSPYGMGTAASRSIVMAGGAVYHACRKLMDKLQTIAAFSLRSDRSTIRLANGIALGPSTNLKYDELADIAWQKIHKLPPGVEPGLEVLHVYRPEIETGTFASGMHAARVAVDVETGVVRILDYVVAEDCGQQINPTIVEGQVRGGVVQGIGQALFEAFHYDDSGQALAGSFMDYAIPHASDTSSIRIEHLHSNSSFGVFGMKGTGEGGAISPPAAIANAVADALRGLNIGVSQIPLATERVWRAIQVAAGNRDPSRSTRTFI